MTTKQKPTSPLLGWMSAGADLVSEQVEQVTGMVSKQLDATHALFEELQQRGETVDDQLRQTLSPTSVFSSLQTLVMANPLFSLFSGNKKASAREQQLQVLSAKVDLLVEQVALLAASKAAEQQAAGKKAATTEKKATPKTATRSNAASASKSSGSTTTASKTASKSTAKPASKRTTKPAARKQSTASKSTSSSGSKPSAKSKKAE